MNLFETVESHILKAVATLQTQGIVPGNAPLQAVTVELPRDSSHGQMATNAAMVLGKASGMAPRLLAEKLLAVLELPQMEQASIDGPGFINFRFAPAFWQQLLPEVLRLGVAYGESTIGNHQSVNVEYVSANPTGPMHVGHARGAVVGDALAALLEKAGFDVTREYYINDAGAQVESLAKSLHWRIREATGEVSGAVPEGLYPGDYLVAEATRLAQTDWRKATEAETLTFCREKAVAAMLVMIREDLAAMGVHHAVFVSEKALTDAGEVDSCVQELDGQGLIYRGVLEPPKGKPVEDFEPRPQLLFRATQFGDDTDRPIQKSDGSWTYFAGDMAYHRDKIRRGFLTMINVWGADHGGYVKRMQAAVKALSNGKATLDVKLCQMVHLMEHGEPVKMSKRAGTFVTLREVVDQVGKDVVRFMMLTRRNDMSLEFDLAKVQEQSKDNPVFYVQYAHARACSVERMAQEQGITLGAFNTTHLTAAVEMELLQQLALWPRLVESAARSHEPHRVAFYAQELASAFHGWWNAGKDDTSLRFILPEQPEVTQARLALVKAVRTVIASSLAVLGVTPRESM
jgi:arginyl-tRNA synthetase